MTTFTITTPVNIDSLSGKTGGDTYNCNGGYLTVDQDSRFGLNNGNAGATTATVMGPITISATLGGTIDFDARYVRLIPFTGGSGTITAGTTITCGSATGKVIGIYSAINTAPVLTGVATGFIKVKAWNEIAFPTSGAFTQAGYTFTISGADTAGWIGIEADESQTCTVPRLGTFYARGTWFEVGTTSGSSATTYQLPTNGGNFYLPGVWVETGTSTGVYEFYPCAGSQTALLANTATDATRGKKCWITAASGLLRFQHDGTNSTGGYLPPSGRKIRIPNLIFNNVVATTRTTIALPNATLATRYDFTTTSAGVIDMNCVIMNWYPSFAQAYSVTLTDTAIMTSLLVSEIAAPITWNGVHIGQEAANAQLGLSMALCFAGGTISNSTFTSATLAGSGRYIVSLTDISDFTFSNNKILTMAYRGNATTGSWTIIRAANCTFSNNFHNGGRMLLTTCSDCTFTDVSYCDHQATTTTIAQPHYIYELGTNTVNCTFSGVSFPVALCQPYSGLVALQAAGCANNKIRNMGTYASPLELGGPVKEGATWTRVITTATITSTAHGLKTGDIIYVINSSDTGAISVGAKTLASAANANTFTFTCTNGGAVSGSITYYPTMSAYVIALAAGAAAVNNKFQRIYTTHTRTGTVSTDNSSKGNLIEHVVGDERFASVSPDLNSSVKGLVGIHLGTGQTSCYGTHWIDNFFIKNTDTQSAKSWSRTTTTATVTSASHTLQTNDLIEVTVSSDTTAIVLGVKTITATAAGTFTFTCLNAGGASGTLTYKPVGSAIVLTYNEPTAQTLSYYTVDSGTPSFTSSGTLYAPVIGDTATFITPNYIIGHTGFARTNPILTAGTITNHNIFYQIDKNDGNGYSGWRNMYYQRTGSAGTSGQFTMTVTDATGVIVGDYVTGTNVGTNAKVTLVNSNTITVDVANAGTVSGTLVFAGQANEASINAELGFKLKVKLATVVTNTTAVSAIRIQTFSYSTSRAYQYTLDSNTLTLTGIVSGSDVVVITNGTNTVVSEGNAIAGTTYSYVYSGAQTVDIAIYKAGYVPYTIRALSLTAADSSLPIAQVIDRNYI